MTEITNAGHAIEFARPLQQIPDGKIPNIETPEFWR